MAVSKSLPRAKTPAEAGVSSKLVREFLDEAKRQHLEFHSLMVVRDGKVAAEWYNEPFNSEFPHSVYSVSKSFTSTAIGFAVSEGLVSLDDKVIDLFPDYPPKKKDPRFEKLTVRTLLTMSSGKQPSMFADKGKIDWIEDFINSPWVFEPGEKFLYVNENIFMLSAIIKRVSGMSMREFLTPRLFEPLGMNVPYWDTDSNGVEAGGWGLYITTEDFAKVMLCYAQGGKYDGQQVIPEEWAREAGKKQMDNSDNGDFPDSVAGYGYCFWKNHIDSDSFRADGLFSQLGMVFPQYKAAVITTSSIPNSEKAINCIWEYFPRAFEEKEDKNDADLSGFYIDKPCQGGRSHLEPTVDDRYIKFNKKILLNIIGFPMSVLPLVVTYMMTDKAGNIDMVKFRFGDKDCTLEWSEGDEKNCVPLGMDGRYRYSTMRLGKTDFKVCSSACWMDERTLFVSIRPIETIAKRTMLFRFSNSGKVTMTPSSTPDVLEVGKFISGTFEQLIGNKLFRKAAQSFMAVAIPLVEPKHRGRFIEGIKKR